MAVRDPLVIMAAIYPEIGQAGFVNLITLEPKTLTGQRCVVIIWFKSAAVELKTSGIYSQWRKGWLRGHVWFSFLFFFLKATAKNPSFLWSRPELCSANVIATHWSQTAAVKKSLHTNINSSWRTDAPMSLSSSFLWKQERRWFLCLKCKSAPRANWLSHLHQIIFM